MPLEPDDTICYCFHVTLRKIETFCRTQHPRAASQISQCLSAGTGCGWCRPMLRKIHLRLCGDQRPWWHADSAPDESPAAALEEQHLDPETYAAGRQKYLKETGRKPPEDAK